jgi:hypothetical protein
MSVHEVTGALDAAKSKITELEMTLETIKEAMASEYKKESQQTEKIHKEEMERQLQIQDKELKEKFNETTSLNQKAHLNEVEKLKATHNQEATKLRGELSEVIIFNERSEREVRRLQHDNDLLKKSVEESQNQTVSLDTIKAEAIKKNEELQDSQKRLFYALNKILKARSDQDKLSIQVKEMHEKYQKSLDTYNRVTEWQDIQQNFPETLPVYSDKQKIRDHRLLNVGMENFMDIQRTQEQVTTTRKELWRSSDSLLSQFGMDPLRNLEKASSTQTMVEDVEIKRNLSMKSIEEIEKISGGYRGNINTTRHIDFTN